MLDPRKKGIEQEHVDDAEYDLAFNQAMNEPTADDGDFTDDSPAALYQSHVSNLGIKLRSLFDEADRNRKDEEDRWLRDLRQYKSQYDPEVLARMHPKRSKAYLSITRTKIKTVSARQLDILFPANEGKNWGITPTPVPDLNPELEQQIEQQISEVIGRVPSPEEVKQVLFEEAMRRCEAMEAEMADQLAEVKYRDIISRVVASGNLYGTGVLKGPLIKENIIKRWVKGEAGWTTIEFRTISPYCEFVPIWDVYPDMTANDPNNIRYVFQRNVMPRHKVYALSKRDDFNTEAVEGYLRAYPDGDAEYKSYESDLKGLGNNATVSTGTIPRKDKYEVIEYWGYLNTDELKDVGVDIDESQLGLECACNVWLLGNVVIKAVVSPIEGITFPYYFYYFDKDETSIFGEGIPVVMRDVQSLFNASIRAMLDNAAISAGPIIEANIELLDPNDDVNDIYPFRVFQRSGTGSDASAAAIRVTALPSYTQEFLGLANFFMTLGDEITVIPRYMAGDNTSLKGAGETATGLSMLMGAVNITLKDQVKNFDEGVTKPFIKALYFWNMEFNKRPDVKGDFSVVARGSSSLIAKEVRSEQLLQFLALTNNPVDMAFINRDVALREILKSYDLSDLELIKNEHQIQSEQKQAQQQAEQEKAFAQEIELLKAKSSGHVGDQGEAKNARPQMERLPQGELEQGAIPEVSGF